MNPCVKIAFVTITLLISTAALAGGPGTITGQEPKGWGDGTYNVVIGRLRNVMKVENAPDAGPDYRIATFIPLATLAGVFDSSLHPTVTVNLYVGAATSSIREVPPDNAFVILVMRTRPTEGEKTPTAAVSSDFCTFMPGRAAIAVVDGPADPRISQTLDRLQKARAISSADPHD